jgi:hypothetical protein
MLRDDRDSSGGQHPPRKRVRQAAIVEGVNVATVRAQLPPRWNGAPSQTYLRQFP